MKLYDLPDKSKLRVELEDGTMADAIFDHPDGMYSYCYTEPFKSYEESCFHLSMSTPVKLMEGRYEIDSPIDND